MTAGAQFTYVSSASQKLNFTTNTVTFSNVNIGVPASDRVVVMGFAHDGGNFGLRLTSFTYNGLPLMAANYVLPSTAGDVIGLWTVADTTASTIATIVITFNSPAANVCILMVGTLAGAVNQVNQTNGYPSGFLADPQVFTSSTPVLGFGVGAVFLVSAPGTNPQVVAWGAPTVLDFTNGFDTLVSRTYSVAHTNQAGAWQPSATGTSGGNGLGFNGTCMVLGTWQQSGLENFQLLGQQCL